MNEEDLTAEQTAGWPATPGPRRLERAHAFLKGESAPAGEDALRAMADSDTLSALLETRVHRRRAGERFVQLQRQDPEDSARYMVALANGIADEEFVGMALCSRRGQEKPYPPGRMGYTFTRLCRDPDWMGLDPTLPHCRGLIALIFESPLRPGTPDVVLAMPPELKPRNTSEGRPLPGGQAVRLAGILSWHGVLETHWIPTDRGDDEP